MKGKLLALLKQSTWDLNSLLAAVDPGAAAAERNLWWVRLAEWLRHAPVHAEPGTRGDTPLPVLRLRLLLQRLEREPDARSRLARMLASTLREMDATLLLADFGFAPRMAFFSEVGERLQRRLLPGTPETRDLSELFQLVFSHPEDAEWLAAIDDETLARVSALVADALAPPEEAEEAPAAGPGGAATRWRGALLDALMFCVSQVEATAFSAEVRTRMSPQAQALVPFRQLMRSFEALRGLIEDEDGEALGLRDPGADAATAAQAGRTADLERAMSYMRAVLDACRRDAATVRDHLEEHGISVDIVFATQQLQARLDRIERLLECLLSAPGTPGAPARTGPSEAARAVQRLFVEFAQTAQHRRSVRALLARNYSLLARKVVERSAEAGEHYITRTRSEYLQMVGRAAGGGAITAITVFVKFLLTGWGLSPFFAGLAAGLNYAVSFVAIQLAHFTLATKQPAMTAPAMAARLADVGTDEAVERFVDELAHLTRTQVAGILGNVMVVLPCVWALQGLAQWALGAPLVGEAKARWAVESLSVLGWTPVFAAGTGVLLFASSLVAGWAENWFVLHRLGSALRWNPRILSRLGAARAQRWAAFLESNISGFAGNVSLGLMLGLVPAVAVFFGIHFDVRHVTLASGQLGAALGALGGQLVYEPAFWLAVAGIAVTGALNVTVSFLLAFRLALRSRNLRLRDRARIYAAVRRRLVQRPGSFLWPPRAAKVQPP
ncbi:site-specific recombinase [Schlegelella aquatica]|uniref:site-specific recombinase n=1 Tax=Caldimonas aquatica TaxID=376175 RepID=UPI0037506BC3